MATRRRGRHPVEALSGKMPPAMMTVDALFAQPDNEAVLRHLNLRRPADVLSFTAGTDGSPFDEGGQIFFHRYGRRVPEAARCSLGIVNITNARPGSSRCTRAASPLHCAATCRDTATSGSAACVARRPTETWT